MMATLKSRVFCFAFCLLWLSAPSVMAQTQCISNALAGGTADQITISFLPCTPTTTTLFLTLIGANLTNAPTLQVIGQTAPQTILRADKTPVQPGDLSGAGAVVQLINNGTNWLLLPGGTASCFQQVDAGGTSDTITIPQQGCALTRQLLLLETTAANVTTTPTLQEAGFPAAVIVNANGTALAPGAIPGPDKSAMLTFNGTNWILISSAGGGGGNITGLGVVGNIPTWSSTTSLSTGLAVGTSGSNLVLQTGPTGLISTSVLANIPSLALANTGAGAGSYVDPNLTVNSQGQITAITSGVAINSGTAGGLPYYSGANTISGTSALTAGMPIIFSGGIPTVGTVSGNTTKFGTTTGTLTNGHCVSIDANGTFVDAGGAGTTGGGGGTVSSGTINQLAYYAASGTTVSGLATANNAVLVTNGTGVPSESTTLPSGLTIASPVISTITNTGTLTLPTTTGTLLESTGTNTVTGTLNVTGTFEIGGVALSIPVSVADGGTGLTSVATNDIPYGAGTSPLSLVAPANNAVLCYSNTGVPSACATLPAAALPAITATGAVTGTSSGTTIALSYPSENANLVLAGPTSGGAAVATFRGLVAADLATALASPPAIGGTTPAAVTASNLTATGSLTTSVTGSTQCLQVNSSGVVAGSGGSCSGNAILNTIPMLQDSSSFGSV